MYYLQNNFNFNVPADLNMYYCGKRSNIPGHSYGPAMRDHFLLVYVKRGEGVFVCNDKTFHLKGKCIFVIFPDTKVFYRADDINPWENMWLGIFGDLIYEYLKTANVTSENPIIELKEHYAIENIIDLIIENSTCQDLSGKINCISLLHKFFSELIKSQGRILHKNNYVDEAISYINFNYERGISSSDIAAYLNIERSYFSKIFRQKMGTPPTAYLNKLRIEKACAFLNNTDLNISDISYSVGIFDQFYFSRLFKSITGKAPASYRKGRIR